MKEHICQECGNHIPLKIPGIELCEKCDAKNWISDPAEIQKELEKDPELSKGVSRPSPYF